MKRFFIAVVVIAGAAVVAHYHVAAQRYYPIVRISAPGGLSFLAVMDAQRERQGCGAANDRFLKPIKQLCKDCRIVYARCDRHLDGLEERLHNGVAVSHPQVDAPGFRMAVVGDPDMARKTCAYVAAAMTKQGVRAAACVAAGSAPPAR